jgi:LacI family transcriptional regulator
MLDIATALGVSRSTVSYALGDTWQEKGISPTTRQAVIDKAAELGYRRNLVATGLKTRKTYTVGVVTPRFADEAFDHILHAAETVLGDQYALITAATRYDPRREKHLIHNFLDRSVDGIMFAYGGPQTDPDLIKQIHAQQVPVVAVDKYFDSIEVDTVCPDEHTIGSTAAQHLIDLGHRHIGYIANGMDYNETGRRIEGYALAMKKAGLKQRVFNLGRDREDVHPYTETLEAIDHAIDEHPQLTAFVTHDDTSAFALLNVMRRRGLKCPDDLSVCGVSRADRRRDVDDLIGMRLTEVRWSVIEMGRQAAELLLERMGQSPEDRADPTTRRIPCAFAPGDTTAAP